MVSQVQSPLESIHTQPELDVSIRKPTEHLECSTSVGSTMELTTSSDISDLECKGLVVVVNAAQPRKTVQFQEEEEKTEEKAVPKCLQIHKAVERSRPSDAREVCFHQVQIRRYPMILGDNPACQMGTPVTLDWGYEELPPLDLDDFESARVATRRTKLQHLVLNYFQRQRILQGMGYSPEELKKAEKKANKTKWQRQTTTFLSPVSKVEEAMQSARRKMKRRFGRDTAATLAASRRTADV